MGMKFKRASGVLTIDSIKQRCVMDGGHWIWKGAMGDGSSPRIWAPDLARDGKMTSMTVARAMWQLKTGQPVPKGQRAYRTCTVEYCVAPQCTGCGTPRQWGKAMAKDRRFSGTAGVIARSKLARAMRILTDEQILEVQVSSDATAALATRYGCSHDVINKAKAGRYPISSPFAGLMQRAA